MLVQHSQTSLEHLVDQVLMGTGLKIFLVTVILDQAYLWTSQHRKADYQSEPVWFQNFFRVARVYEVMRRSIREVIFF